MNISACKTLNCQGHLHQEACPKAPTKQNTHSDKSAYNESAQEPLKHASKDSLILSEEASQKLLHNYFNTGESNNSDHSGRDIEEKEIEAEGEDMLHDEHAHDHDDDDDDHESLAGKPVSKSEMSREELKAVRELQARDREVRAHEQAHVAASGRIPVSGPQYEYETGPDGKRYAVGGSVNYRVPPASSPEEELRLAQQLRRMALAPMDPSPQDRATAGKATAKAAQANQDIREERAEELAENSETAAKEKSGGAEKIEAVEKMDPVNPENDNFTETLIQAYNENNKASDTGTHFSATA